MKNNNNIIYKPYTPEDFAKVIELGNRVHGDNYIDEEKAELYYQSGLKNDINASRVAYDGDKLVGFRLTLAAEQWPIDEWCTPEQWNHTPSDVCYFKCNTVDETYRGYGVGSELLKRSIVKAKEQGAMAGLAHIWMASPGNSAFKYFTKCGGVLVKEHPNRWQGWYEIDGYICPVCGEHCTCTAAEMIIHFDK